jgi:hypothetical protein
MKSIGKTESSLTHGIDRENGITIDPEIFSETWVNVDLEIIIENWVTAYVWNRQQKLIHHWLLKSLAKTDSSLTHGIISENYVTREPEIISETWVTIDRSIVVENWVTPDVWNRQWKLAHGWLMKSIGETKSSLMNGFLNKNCVPIDPEIISETWVTIDRSIAIENWVMTDIWNWQRKQIHGCPRNLHSKLSCDCHIESFLKTNSPVTRNSQRNCVTTDPEIVSENRAL